MNSEWSSMHGEYQCRCTECHDAWAVEWRFDDGVVGIAVAACENCAKRLKDEESQAMERKDRRKCGT